MRIASAFLIRLILCQKIVIKPVTLATPHKLDANKFSFTVYRRMFWIQVKTLGIFCHPSSWLYFIIQEFLKVFLTISSCDQLSRSSTTLNIKTEHSEVSDVRWNIYRLILPARSIRTNHVHHHIEIIISQIERYYYLFLVMCSDI